MDQRPIGVFDSGQGGLTAVREIQSILPSENIIYFGDTSRVPYGGKSPEILLRFARQDVRFLRSFDIKAPLVENGRFRPGDAVIETVAREYLTPLKETGIDTLMLGCTHYPLLMEIIGEIMGPEVTLINAGAEAARALRGELEARDMLAQRPQGETTLYASDSPADFAALAGQFLCRPIGKDAVGLVDIERY